MSNEGFYLLDRRGRFLYVNAKGHAQMGGYTMEELLSLTVSDICPDVLPERFAENVAALADGPLPLVEAWTRRKDGTMFLVEVSMARLEFAGDVYLFGVACDITERKAAETVRKSLAAQLLHTIERERQRVARELHDDVGQALATIGVLLDAIEISPATVPESVRPALTATRATIAEIAESLARIVREYHPVELLGLGLEDTLRAHAPQFADRHKLALRLTTEPVEGLLTPEQELHVYRIVQEALANAARHARAKSLQVALTRAPDRLVVRVRDDGIGFTPDAPTCGIGLVTMRERAMLMRGELTIESAPGRGTAVQLVLPLAAEQAATEPSRAATPTHGPAEARASTQGALRSDEPAATRPLPAALDLEVFRRMADMSSEAFMLADRDGRFIYVNDCACTLSGFDRGELLTMSVSDINPDFPPPEWREWVVTARGAAPPFETRHWCKDGTLIPVEISAARIERPDEPYFFGVVRDISERKEAEAAQNGFTRRLLHTLEAERQRVARELHDEVGQAIAAVGVLLHTLENTLGSIPQDLQQELAATYATIRQITESVARIVRDYHPADLLALGLEETLRTHARQFAQRHKLTLRLATVSAEGLLSDEHALHVYRIVQEALANVARHACARHVSVRLVRQRRRLVATVRDDGAGFDAACTRAGRLGLVTMRERAALMDAALQVRSTPGRGTEVRLTVAVGAPGIGR
ncbi:MAG: PAS domain S-box protein [Deltaproteobacteria bacterium]|nr:PAS domain S-box protein [Deltaproteobacteria bacterium]